MHAGHIISVVVGETGSGVMMVMMRVEGVVGGVGEFLELCSKEVVKRGRGRQQRRSARQKVARVTDTRNQRHSVSECT